MIFEFNSTETVPAYEVKRRALQVFAGAGEPMREVTYAALQAENKRLQAEVASLRLTLGGKTFSADVPEPIGCPAPGACVQVAEIGRLRAALTEVRDVLTAPVWSEEEVAALNAHQANPRVHPYTCPGDEPQCKGRRNLIATRAGWVCRCGEYRQGWAHGVGEEGAVESDRTSIFPAEGGSQVRRDRAGEEKSDVVS